MRIIKLYKVTRAVATKKFKTPSEVITEFLDTQSNDKSLDADTVAAICELRKDDDLSKVRLLRKLEDSRKAVGKADRVSPEDAGDA